MGEESPNSTVTTPTGAVFLSYASQDQEAAQRICEALRTAGIEVWFDQSALRGGDVWDQTIRKQIKSCVLFIPVISQHTHDRVEGYFRLEWKLAIDRSHLIASDQTFLLPVVIDDTREDDERVPDRFKDIHWTRLRGGETRPDFVQRVQRLVSHAPLTTELPATRAGPIQPALRKPPHASWWPKPMSFVVVAVLAIALAYFVIDKFRIVKHRALPPAPPVVHTTAQGVFAPPPHSIAVLPFVNMSGDKEQEYFSDGLTEELLNSLSRINDLQVAARTSSFSFKGKDADIGSIARKLNVAVVLEGSVRRSAHTVRVTAQLINAVTGFHMWSQTYDRNLGDVLKLQTEISEAVAAALKVTLLGDEATKIEVGGTRNPAAFDVYLRAMKAYFNAGYEERGEAAIAGYTEAIRLDPDYALAYAARSLAFARAATVSGTTTSATRADLDKAQADARKAIALAPNLAEGHTALALVYLELLKFTQASEEYERARSLAPGNARVLWNYAGFAVLVGRSDAGLTAARRAVALDPLNAQSHYQLGGSLYFLRRYTEAITAYKDAESLKPGYASTDLGVAYYLLGNLENARSYCEKGTKEIDRLLCLTVVYEKMGQHADAEAALARVRAVAGDSWAWNYSAVYAQWGDPARALDWLDTAMRLRDPTLIQTKVDPFMDPLRKEPRFQAILRELKFPSN
jgi:TolB-like protein/Flp pilus assembly protein TadD